MNILGWIMFALINVVTLFLIDYDPGKKSNLLDNAVFGFTGALSSALFIYFVAKGMTPEFGITFSLVILLETFLLMTLLLSKSFTRSLHH